MEKRNLRQAFCEGREEADVGVAFVTETFMRIVGLHEGSEDISL